MAQSSEAKTVPITPIEVAVINASDYLNDKDNYIENVVVQALQKQVDKHFAPAWGITAHLRFIGGDSAHNYADMIKRHPWAQEAWWLVLLDNSDVAGLRGYHDVTTEGRPLGKVFAKTDAQYDRDWTVGASHELLEMLVDPGMNLTGLKPTNTATEQSTTGQLYAYEVCDPCDADQYSIRVNKQHDVSVSNFVYPAWFEWFQKKPGIQFDYKKSLNEPFELLRPGGFSNVLDIPYGTGWRQISSTPAQSSDIRYLRYRLRPLVGSRRERRLGTIWSGGGPIESDQIIQSNGGAIPSN